MLFLQFVAEISLISLFALCILHVTNIAPIRKPIGNGYYGRLHPFPFAVGGILALAGAFSLPFAFGWVG